LKKAPKDYIQEQYIPEKLKASSIFLNDYLFLYAEDFISQEKIGAIDIAQVGADVAVLMYNRRPNNLNCVFSTENAVMNRCISSNNSK